MRRHFTHMRWSAITLGCLYGLLALASCGASTGITAQRSAAPTATTALQPTPTVPPMPPTRPVKPVSCAAGSLPVVGAGGTRTGCTITTEGTLVLVHATYTLAPANSGPSFDRDEAKLFADGWKFADRVDYDSPTGGSAAKLLLGRGAWLATCIGLCFSHAPNTFDIQAGVPSDGAPVQYGKTVMAGTSQARASHCPKGCAMWGPSLSPHVAAPPSNPSTSRRSRAADGQ